MQVSPPMITNLEKMHLKQVLIH